MAAALKIPIYLDSIGTVLVGVLAGPIAGAATGALTNILWSYVVPPPFQNPPASRVRGGGRGHRHRSRTAGRYGLMRPRPNRPTGELIVAGVLVAAIIIGLAWLASVGYTLIFDTDLNPLPTGDDQLFVVLGYVAVLLVVAAVLGVFALLFGRRDITAAYAVVPASRPASWPRSSAPRSPPACLAGDRRRHGLPRAALRQAGVDIYAATTGQGLISDPIDKATTFVIVYLITVAMAVRLKARFPQGEQLIEEPAHATIRRARAEPSTVEPAAPAFLVPRHRLPGIGSTR